MAKKSNPIRDELEYIFGDENVSSAGKNKLLLTDTILNESLSVNINTFNLSPKVTVFKDCGIWVKNKAVFLLNETLGTSIDIPDFSIGEVKASIIECPPTLYLSIKNEISHTAGLTGEEFMESATCILLENVELKVALEYLDKALFKIGHCGKWETKHWPRVGNQESRNHEYFDLEKDESYNPDWFEDSNFKHVHPINSFNAAKSTDSPTSKFISYYRVLEFYWDIAVDEELLSIKEKKIKNEDYLKKIKSTTNLNEKASLKLLIERLVDQDALDELNDIVLEGGKYDRATLSTNIYKDRCRLVHAKSSRIDDIGFSERFVGEMVDWDLLKCVEWLALRAIEVWGVEEK
ncbi:hypothetical protein [Bdellovibrio bacteriovorus]|uniref:hypothetical protein n=1 Tax=Bdellovibrio bacteriovorus TaxID=959 RepID=UPI003D08632F